MTEVDFWMELGRSVAETHLGERFRERERGREGGRETGA